MWCCFWELPSLVNPIFYFVCFFSFSNCLFCISDTKLFRYSKSKKCNAYSIRHLDYNSYLIWSVVQEWFSTIWSFWMKFANSILFRRPFLFFYMTSYPYALKIQLDLYRLVDIFCEEVWLTAKIPSLMSHLIPGL